MVKKQMQRMMRMMMMNGSPEGGLFRPLEDIFAGKSVILAQTHLGTLLPSDG